MSMQDDIFYVRDALMKTGDKEALDKFEFLMQWAFDIEQSQGEMVKNMIALRRVAKLFRNLGG